MTKQHSRRRRRRRLFISRVDSRCRKTKTGYVFM